MDGIKLDSSIFLPLSKTFTLYVPYILVNILHFAPSECYCGFQLLKIEISYVCFHFYS